MITRTYHFNEACYQYDAVDVEIREDDKHYIVLKRALDLYFGKTNIPSMPRKEK